MSTAEVTPLEKKAPSPSEEAPTWALRFQINEHYRIWLAGWNLVVKITEAPRRTKGIHGEWIVKGQWEGTGNDYEITEATVNASRIDHLPTT
jgi:hypothetical protein